MPRSRVMVGRGVGVIHRREPPLLYCAGGALRRIDRPGQITRGEPVRKLKSSRRDRVRTSTSSGRPLLMVDIDGVVSLLAAFRRPRGRPRAPFHFDRRHTPLPFGHRRRTPARACAELRRSCGRAAGRSGPTNTSPTCWACLGGLPFLRFERAAGAGRSRTRTGSSTRSTRTRGERPLAWIDDALNDACHAWADSAAPTLLVRDRAQRQGLTRAGGQGASWRRVRRLEAPEPSPYTAISPARRRDPPGARRLAWSARRSSPALDACRRAPPRPGSSGISSSASSSAKPGSVPPAPIFSSEARSASNSCP